jgi:primosomal protein N' (replication factor Y) (superfamily II helicase)
VSTAPVGATFAEVAVPVPLPGPLTYRLPAGMAAFARPGQRVRVPVGRRTVTGVLWKLVPDAPEGIEIRDVASVADLEPVLTPDLLELARFASEYYLAPLGETVAAMLPQDLPAWGETRVALTDAGALAPARDDVERELHALLLARGRLSLAQVRLEVRAEDLPLRIERLAAEGRLTLDGPERRGSRYVTAVETAPGDPSELLSRCGRSAAGRAVVEHLLAAARPATVDELRAATGASPAVIRRLVTLGVLRRFSQPGRLSLARHLLPPSKAGEAEAILLRADQSEALAALRRGIQEHRFERFLLQGVTGSGKTEVYLRAALEALDLGRSVLLLVPEIALVPALARTAAERFGGRLAVLHSGLGSAERQQEWERIRKGEARVVVGPRSALFAPVVDLGLIVVDEEQDLAYKQETSPRYHGRDLALVRCRSAGAVAVLVSATPSLESRLAADRGRLRRLTLTRRVGIGRLPEGIPVDLRTEPKVGRPGEVVFSERLLSELRDAIAAGDQAILLRNRRGYAPMLLCRACGEDFRCPDCGLARTFHRRAGRLLCHYCGSSLAVPASCPVCRAEALDPVGAGKERVEEELAALLPGVAIWIGTRPAGWAARRRSWSDSAAAKRASWSAPRCCRKVTTFRAWL